MFTTGRAYMMDQVPSQSRTDCFADGKMHTAACCSTRSTRRSESPCTPCSDVDCPQSLHACCKPTMNASYFNVASFDMDIHRSLPKKKSFTAEDDADCSDCCTGAVCPDGDAEVTEHCTDKCVVIACEDSSHHIDAAGCAPDPCDFLCDLDPCRGCHPLDDFVRLFLFLSPHLIQLLLQFEKCCEPDFHHSFPEKHSIFHPTFHWDPSSICRSCDEPEELPLSSSSSHFPDPHLPDMNRFSHQQPLHPHVFQQPHGPQACLWGNCGQQFEDSDQLIKHVNEVHFLLPSSPSVSIPQSNTLPCLWGDCHQSLPVTPQAYGHALSQMMANHLLNDHLNSQWPVHSHPSTPILDYSLPSSESESVPTPPHVHTPCSGTHVCHWKDCDQAFVTCSDLTTHLTVAHVGAGKAHYDCHWKECNRNGNHGFASKQKICRHLQVYLLL